MQKMHLLPTMSPSNTIAYNGGCNYSSNSQNPPPPGFTLLQGHIQLMAMVPNLPENHLSPRHKEEASIERNSLRHAHNSATKTNVSHHPENIVTGCSSYTQNDEVESPYITPQRMPSVSKHKRLDMSSLTAEKACQNQYQSFQWPPAHSPGIILPPTARQPVTMPSFAKGLPGTKRPSHHRLMGQSSMFPIIPNHPSYHSLSAAKEKMMESPNDLYMNPYQCFTQTPFGYQQVPNFIPSPQMGAGDNHSMFVPVQQSFYGLPNSNCILFPDNTGLYANPHLVSYPPQSPYASQSIPCFGSYNMNNMRPEPVELPSQIPQPIYSASMPDICMSPPEIFQRSAHSQTCHPVPVYCRSSKGVAPGSRHHGTVKQEVSVMVEDSSSDCEYPMKDNRHEYLVQQKAVRKSKISSTGSSKTSLLRMSPNLTRPTTIVIDDSNYNALGPESLPTKIPSVQRVSHTPMKQQGKMDKNNDSNDVDDNVCCSKCKCCMSKNSEEKPKDGNCNDEENNQNAELTARRKGAKPVNVVAVHDCFPSDSSESLRPEEPVKKSSFSPHINHNGLNSSIIKKRKPRLDSILSRTKPNGEPDEVFKELGDLTIDEARLCTCEYLTDLLSSADWKPCFEGLQIMVRMARHRPKQLLQYLHPILWFAYKHLCSPKSALCRAAIATFRELFQKVGSALDGDLEKLTEKLVTKSLAPNNFIRDECNKALEAMVSNCNLVKVLYAMENLSKKTKLIGQRIAELTKQFVQVAGVDTCLKSAYAEKLLPMLFGFMTNANNCTRAAAKDTLGMLMNHLQFEAAVTKHVTFDRNCTEVFKKLDKMRDRTRNRGIIHCPCPPKKSVLSPDSGPKVRRMMSTSVLNVNRIFL